MHARSLVVRIALGTVVVTGLLAGCVTIEPPPPLDAAGTARALRPSSPEGCKTRFVNTKIVLSQYDKVRPEYLKLQEGVEEMQGELDLTSQAIELARKQLEADRDTVSTDTYERRAAQIEAAREEYLARLQSDQESIEVKEQALLDTVMDDIKRACRAVGRQVGADRVVLAAAVISPDGDRVRSAMTDSHDLTDQVIAFLNNEAKGDGP